jgi:hypothetical protein
MRFKSTAHRVEIEDLVIFAYLRLAAELRMAIATIGAPAYEAIRKYDLDLADLSDTQIRQTLRRWLKPRAL